MQKNKENTSEVLRSIINFTINILRNTYCHCIFVLIIFNEIEIADTHKNLLTIILQCLPKSVNSKLLHVISISIAKEL